MPETYTEPDRPTPDRPTPDDGTTQGLTRIPDSPRSDRHDRPGSVTAIAALGILFGLIYLVAVPVGTFLGTSSNQFPDETEIDSGTRPVEGGAGGAIRRGVPDTDPTDGTASVDRTGDANSPARTDADMEGRADERATTGAFTLAASIFGMLMGAAALIGSYGSLKLLPIARSAMNVWAAATIGFVLVGALAAFWNAGSALSVVIISAILVATLAYAAAVLVVYRRPEVRAAFGATDD